MLAVALSLVACAFAQPQPMELYLTDFEDGTQAPLVGQQLPPKCSASMVGDPVHSGKVAAHLHYDYPSDVQGVMYAGITLSGAAPHFLAGSPTRFSVWVYGDGSSLSVRLRLDDAAAQTFQYDLGKLNFKGWRQLSCDLTHDNGHWGGDASGKVKLPLQFNSLLVDSDVRPSVGDVYFDDLSYVTAAESKEAFQVTTESGWFGDVIFSADPWTLKVTVRNMSTAHVGGTLVVSAADSRGNPVAHATQTVSLDAGASAVVNLKPSAPTAGLIYVKATIAGTTAGPFRLAVLPQPSELKPAPDGFFGACTHFGQGKHRIPQTLELMRRGGVEWLRDEIGWGAVEKKKGEYTYDNYYEQYMAAAGKTGVTPFIIADYTNPFYDGGQSPHDPEGWDGLANYAADLATHYDSVLRDVEVYNEPNIGFWAGRKPSSEEYFGLLKATYAAVKKAQPDDTVVGVCTAGTDLGYIEGVLKLGGGKYMDAMSIHPYRYPGSPEATHFVDELNRCYDLMCKYGMEGKKLWLTEIGWPTHTGPGGVDEQTSANYLVRMYTLAHSLPYVARVMWYDLQDDGRDPTYNEARFGILTLDASQAKPGFVGYYVMTRYLAGAKFVKALLPSSAEDARYAYLFRQGDRDIIVAWADGREESASLDLGGKRVHLQWVDAYGEDRPTPGGVLSLKLTDMPVFIAGKFPGLKLAASPVSLALSPQKPAPGDTVTLTAKVSADLAIPERRVVLTPPEGWGEPRDVNLTKTTRTATARFRVPDDAKLGPARFALSVVDPDESISAEAARSVVVSPFLSATWMPTGVTPAGLYADAVYQNPRDTGEKGARLVVTAGPEGKLCLDHQVDIAPRMLLRHAMTLPLPTHRRADWPLTITAEARGHRMEVKTSYPVEHVKRVDGLKIDGDLSDWNAAGVEADDLGPADWESLEPGKPAPDLRASGRLAWTPEGLWLAVAVTDDKHHQNFAPEDMWNGDCLQIAADLNCAAWRSLVTGTEAKWLELGFALGDDGKQVSYSWRPDASRLAGVRSIVVRKGDVTTYEAFLPAKSLGGASLKADGLIGFGFVVNDNDGAGRRGWLQLYKGIGYGKDPRQFGLLVLDPPAR